MVATGKNLIGQLTMKLLITKNKHHRHVQITNMLFVYQKALIPAFDTSFLTTYKINLIHSYTQIKSASDLV